MMHLLPISKQFNSGTAKIGNIMNMADLNVNLAENALPPEIIHMTFDDYDDFLSKRCHLMARMIEEYYKHL